MNGEDVWCGCFGCGVGGDVDVCVYWGVICVCEVYVLDVYIVSGLDEVCK